ncbi:MAG: FKBP-type peptidyl-prolyl cis-trans isomerase [Aureibaculum sp.]|nr:FKBP-type peptidyl-prolyl cis-trans isomerase [Aureibaculum sp.]
MKLKYIIPILTLLIVFYSCNKDSNDDEIFDAAAQSIIDDESLVDYLQSHYYIPAGDNEPFGTVDTIMNNESSLFGQVETQNITHDDISYKLYYLLIDQGVNDNPTRYDSVFVKYRGFTLDSLKFDESTNFNTTRSWLDLNGVIQGWKYGFPNFKSGNNISEPGEPISFEDNGKGILFIPSGLAYGNFGASSIPPNAPLLFHIELAIVVRADNDNDGVLNMDEDLDGNGEASDDDTDGDSLANFIDPDDDGDGTLTRDESITEDADGDGIVDYLDPDTK